MSFKDLGHVDSPNGFNLYLPANASTARRIAQRKYVAAIETLAAVRGDPARALADVARCRRNYGAILLREDKQARPDIYRR